MCLCFFMFTLGGVKSFLERFGERCQERNQSSPSTSGGQSHTPAATPSATPKSRLLQERLGGAQASSSTAILTQKQKMARMSCTFYIKHVCVNIKTYVFYFYRREMQSWHKSVIDFKKAKCGEAKRMLLMSRTTLKSRLAIMFVTA